MHRLLLAALTALLLSVTGLLVAPAQAALGVTITASATTVPSGSSVTFSGRATDARLGSVVALQRRTSDGWRTVARKEISSTRTFRFTTTPPRGYQDYRVRKPAQLGQRAVASGAVTVKVTWKPRISQAVTHGLIADNASVTRVHGYTPDLAGVTLAVQQYDETAGTWVARSDLTVAVGADGHYRTQFVSWADGIRLRLVAPASGARLATPTPWWTLRLTPVPVTVDGEPVVVRGFGGDSVVTNEHPWVARMTFTAEAGEHIGVAVESDDATLAGSAWGPDGAPVAFTLGDSGSTGVGDLVAPLTGTYTVRLHGHSLSTDWVRYWVSRDLVDATEVPSEGRSTSYQYDGDVRPGQAVLRQFTGSAGELIAIDDEAPAGYCPDHRRITVGDAAVEPGFREETSGGWTDDAVLLPSSGTVRIRYVPCTSAPISPDPAVARNPSFPGEVDGADIDVDRGTSPFAQIPFQATAGQVIDIAQLSSGGTWRLLGPDGRLVPGVSHGLAEPVTIVATGTHHLVFVATTTSLGRFSLATHRGK